MRRARFAIVYRLAAAALAWVAFIHLANAPEIGFKIPVDPPPQQQPPPRHLATNPKLLRQLPPAGWIAEHSGSWVTEHAVYQETCQTPAVVDEIRYLNRVIGYDEYLINVTQAYMKSAAAERDDTGVKQADFAAGRIDSLRSDVAVADGLSARLQGLPVCAALPVQPVRLDRSGG